MIEQGRGVEATCLIWSSFHLPCLWKRTEIAHRWFSFSWLGWGLITEFVALILYNLSSELRTTPFSFSISLSVFSLISSCVVFFSQMGWSWLIDSSDCSQVRVQLYIHGWSCKVIICCRICFFVFWLLLRVDPVMKALWKLTAELAVSTQEETKVDTAAAGGERIALKIIALWSETQARLAATYRQPHAYSTKAHTHTHTHTHTIISF